MFKKKLFLLSFIFLFSSQTFSEDLKVIENDQACFKAGDIAQKIIDMRQNDNTIQKALSLSQTISKGDQNIYLLFRHITLKAYQEPIGENNLDKEKISRAFKNNIIVECMNDFDTKLETEIYKLDKLPESWEVDINQNSENLSLQNEETQKNKRDNSVI